jgi:nitroreductase
MADLDFDIGTVTGLTTDAVAQSSDGSLPTPRTDRPRTLAEVIGAARLADRFAADGAPSADELSQLLWAACGCTPHFASGGRAGLTVPSRRAEYFLVDTVYAVSDRVERYRMHSGASLTTRDHRLDLVHDADVRSGLRAALPGLPEAPCYIVLCLPQASAAQWYAMLEVGFAAGGILLQATALDLGCGLRAGLSSAEQEAVRTAARLPGEHVPHAVASVGSPLSESTPRPAYVPFGRRS